MLLKILIRSIWWQQHRHKAHASLQPFILVICKKQTRLRSTVPDCYKLFLNIPNFRQLKIIPRWCPMKFWNTLKQFCCSLRPCRKLNLEFVQDYGNNTEITFIQPMFPSRNINFFRVLYCTEDVLHESLEVVPIGMDNCPHWLLQCSMRFPR